VVLSLVLADKALLPDNVMPPVDAFVFAADESVRALVKSITAGLRTAGRHARMTYRATTSVGKLLKEADQCGARFAVIVEGDSADTGNVTLKNLGSGEQKSLPIDELAQRISNP
jgi:histidyl-tRNA synthetase